MTKMREGAVQRGHRAAGPGDEKRCPAHTPLDTSHPFSSPLRPPPSIGMQFVAAPAELFPAPLIILSKLSLKILTLDVKFNSAPFHDLRRSVCQTLRIFTAGLATAPAKQLPLLETRRRCSLLAYKWIVVVVVVLKGCITVGFTTDFWLIVRWWL